MGGSVAVRAIADRPEDEKRTDLNCASLIVNTESLLKEGAPNAS
jgi:hypothetical protein